MPYRTLSTGRRQYYGGNYKTERDLGLVWITFKNGNSYINHLFWHSGVGKPSLCGHKTRRGATKHYYHGYVPDCQICQKIFEDMQE